MKPTRKSRKQAFYFCVKSELQESVAFRRGKRGNDAGLKLASERLPAMSRSKLSMSSNRDPDAWHLSPGTTENWLKRWMCGYHGGKIVVRWNMALNIKNATVERLAEEVAKITGESKTEAVRKALEERKTRLKGQVFVSKRERWEAFLNDDVWPTIHPDQLGRILSRDEEDRILGYGAEGV